MSCVAIGASPSGPSVTKTKRERRCRPLPHQLASTLSQAAPHGGTLNPRIRQASDLTFFLFSSAGMPRQAAGAGSQAANHTGAPCD